MNTHQPPVYTVFPWPASSQELINLPQYEYYVLLCTFVQSSELLADLSEADLLCLVHIMRLQRELKRQHIHLAALACAMLRTPVSINRYIVHLKAVGLLAEGERVGWSHSYDLAPLFARLKALPLIVAYAPLAAVSQEVRGGESCSPQ